MIAIGILIMGAGFGWALLNFAAGSMDPTPSMRQYETQVILGGFVVVIGLGFLVGGLLT